MSEHNPFEAAIDVLECIVKEHEQEVGWKDDVQDWKEAIRILESWPRWEKLIATAGKLIAIKGDSPRNCVDRLGAINALVDAAYLAAIPD